MNTTIVTTVLYSPACPLVIVYTSLLTPSTIVNVFLRLLCALRKKKLILLFILCRPILSNSTSVFSCCLRLVLPDKSRADLGQVPVSYTHLDVYKRQTSEKRVPASESPNSLQELQRQRKLQRCV